MKKIHILTIIGLFLFSAYSIAQSEWGGNSKKIKWYAFIPKGTFQIENEAGTGSKIIENKESFEISETEVTNEMYLQFLADLKKQGKTADYEIAKIDTANWLRYNINGAAVFAKEYHLKKDFPVVNISKEGAMLYCQWLTENRNAVKDKDHFDTTRYTYRLPTSMEWMCAASGQISRAKYATLNSSSLKDESGAYQAQVKTAGELPYGPVKVKTFKANDYGLYDMTGNVAEMVYDIPFTKGGSWNSEVKNLSIISQEPFEKSPFVGFRVVVVPYR